MSSITRSFPGRVDSFLRRLSAVVVAAAVTALPARAQAGDFADDFEASTLDAFWTMFSNSGFVTFPSTAQVHGGSQALELDTIDTLGVNKAAGVRHVFSTPTYGRISAWLYDSGADISSSNYFTLHAPPFSVGTWDYDLGGGEYQYTAGSASGDSTVDRSQDWHHFVITSTPTMSSVEIDGTLVYSGPGAQPFQEVQLEMHAPYWRPAFASYWDDFELDCTELASWSNYGNGYPGTYGVPSLTAQGDPSIGSTATIDLANSSGQLTTCCIVIGAQAAFIPTGKGGELLVDPALLTFHAILPSGLAIGGAIPDDVDLCGVELFLQALELDPGAAHGVSFSPGLQLTLGY